MSEPFDPYYVWLGIPPEEQPPHYYRLLGIRLFEPDPQVIENAAQRIAMHVASLRTGPYQTAAEHVLNEVRAAHDMLLNTELRPGYDQALDAALRGPMPEGGVAPAPVVVHVPLAPQPTAAPVVVHVPVEHVISAAPEQVPPRPPHPPRHSQRRASAAAAGGELLPQPAKIVLGGLVGLILGYLLVYFLLGEDVLGLFRSRRQPAPAHGAP